MNTTQFRARQLAAHIYAEECKAKGAMMQGGFGFLSPGNQQPYIDKALEQIIAEEEAEQEAQDNGQFGVGA